MMFKFGDKVVIEYREDLGVLLVISHVGEDVTLVSNTGAVYRYNGSFVVPVAQSSLKRK